MTDLYRTYAAFKQWDGSLPGPNIEEFAYLTEIAGCAAADHILEIGFGAGQFLDWAREAGFKVAGTEIIPAMIEAARNRGHSIFDNLSGEIYRKFDLVIALDVFEHVPTDELVQMLSRIRSLLNPGGRLVARFPNGDSPFNGRYQNGDATHLKSLTATSFSQIAASADLKVVLAINPRPLPIGWTSRIKRKIVYFARDLIEVLLGRIYFSSRFPMDPNILVVLKPC